MTTYLNIDQVPPQKKSKNENKNRKTIFLKVTNHVSDLEMISLDQRPNWSILPQSQPD